MPLSANLSSKPMVGERSNDGDAVREEIAVLRRKFPATRRAILLGLLGLSSSSIFAQSSQRPERPIRVVVPFAPGGTTDIIARLVGDRLAASLHQPVVVENRIGAGGALGSVLVAKAPPDGYTLGMATQSTHAANSVLTSKPLYDPIHDFAPITMLAVVPGVLSVHPTLPANSIHELIVLAKARPGELAYGTPGVGSLGHLLMAQFEDFFKVELVHVPYAGAGAMLNDALSGQLQLIGDNLPSSLPHIKAGRLRALGVMASARVTSLPDVPTYAELGLGEIGKPAWFGMVAPAGTPRPVIDRLNEALHAVLKEREVLEKLAESGSTVAASTPEEFALAIVSTLESFRAVARARNIKRE